jgi:hypothetical protein
MEDVVFWFAASVVAVVVVAAAEVGVVIGPGEIDALGIPGEDFCRGFPLIKASYRCAMIHYMYTWMSRSILLFTNKVRYIVRIILLVWA